MLLTVALIGQLAQLAVELAGQVGSSEYRGSVGVYTASTVALDQNRPGQLVMMLTSSHSVDVFNYNLTFCTLVMVIVKCHQQACCVIKINEWISH